MGVSCRRLSAAELSGHIFLKRTGWPLVALVGGTLFSASWQTAHSESPIPKGPVITENKCPKGCPSELDRDGERCTSIVTKNGAVQRATRDQRPVTAHVVSPEDSAT